MVSKEEDNFLRIVYLHYRVATVALTNFFDNLHPDLSADLNIQGNMDILKDLHTPPPRQKRVLYQGQWDTLYPTAVTGTTKVTSADLDLTLIVCLLRNLPPVVTEPPTGFDNLPPLYDKSSGANIARLKYYKNVLVSHSKDGKLSNANFVKIWNELEQAIKGLDNSQATAASLKDAETKILDNSMAQLLSTQIQLDKKVSSFEDELEQISIYIGKDVQEKKEHQQLTHSLSERMRINEDTIERKFKTFDINVDKLSEKLISREEQMHARVVNIEEHLNELQSFQKPLNLQFARTETIVKESKTEQEDFVKNVQSLCSQIQDDTRKQKERIETLENKSESLLREIDSLNIKTDCIEAEIKQQDEDHIPKNIRAQNEDEINEWEQDQTLFVKTRATHRILESLLTNSCIVVTGSLGCGKSSNIHHAALYLRDNCGYEIIPVLIGPSDIMKYYDEKQKQVFVVDDICGKETINKQTLQMWRDYSEKLEKKFKIAEIDVENKKKCSILKLTDHRLLISCRLHIFKESQFQHLKLFTRKDYNLLSADLCLLKKEKVLIARMYIPDDITDKLNVTEKREEVDFFPLLCKLSKDKSSEEVIKLFTAPVGSIMKNITHIVNENKRQFCALVLCILFDNEFKVNWLKLRSAPEEQKKKVEDIVKEFDIDLSKEISRNSLKSGFITLDGTFLKRTGKEGYRMIHDKIHKMAAVICGQQLTECFIKYAHPTFIRDHFILEFIMGREANDYIIRLSEDQEEEYFERLLSDLNKNIITSTFLNKQLTDKIFTDKLISFWRGSDVAKQILRKCREWYDGKTPLLVAASEGYFRISQFLIVEVQCYVNMSDSCYRTPLSEASKGNHIDVVELLLENNACVIQSSSFGVSALYVACKEGHTDIVKMLLNKKANIWCFDGHLTSPLYVACKKGYADIVNLLLLNNAYIPVHDEYKRTALYIACEKGHIEVVKLLLLFKADSSLCNDQGESPLSIACERGHRGIVELLLDNNADASHYSMYGQSPLLMACQEGHTEIVKLLLQKNVDVRKSDTREESPLYLACESGHTNIVEMLLQKNADIFKYNQNGQSPIFMACKEGHIKIAELLLQKNADIFQCNIQGWSPLHVSCQWGHIDIMKLLLENHANVSQCDYDGRSSLYLACEQGHLDAVKLLLQYNVDISQCNDRRESSLCVATKRGHLDVVKLLQQNGALAK